MASLSGLMSPSSVPPPTIRMARAWPWRAEDPSSVVLSSLPRLHAQCVASFTPKGRRIANGNGNGSQSLELEIHTDDPRVVSLVHSGSHIVDRVFRFQTPVLDAALAHFSSRQRAKRRRVRLPNDSTPNFHEQPPFVCILSRSDCVSVYAPNGETYEVALPFHADRILALSPAVGGGLLLQRRPLTPAPSAAATAVAFSPSHARSPPGSAAAGALRAALLASNDAQLARPRFFTLAHPLEEVKPIALKSHSSTQHRRARPPPSAVAAGTKQVQFLADPALDLVDVCVLPKSNDQDEDEDEQEHKDTTATTTPGDPERALLVCFHRHERRFLVFEMARHRTMSASASAADTGDLPPLHNNPNQTPTKHSTLPFSPSTPTGMASFVSPAKMRQQQREVAMMEQYFKSHIVPERSVQLVWTSPCLDALAESATTNGTSSRNFSSSARSTDWSSSDSSSSPWLHQRAFLMATNDDDDDDQRDESGFSGDVFPLRLGLVDERFGVLLFKPIRLTVNERVRDRESDLRVLRCQSAVPLTLVDKDDIGHSSETMASDVLIVAHNGERFFLFTEDRVVAELSVPDTGRSSQRRRQIRVGTAGHGTFVIHVGSSKQGRAESRWYSHPRRVATSSLLQSTLRVLQFALPTKEYLKLSVSTLAIVSASHQGHDDDDVEWSAFCALVLASAGKLSGSSTPEEEEPSFEHGAPKKARPTEREERQNKSSASDDVVSAVLQSRFAANYQSTNATFLGSLDIATKELCESDSSHESRAIDLSEDAFGRILTALHLLHEDLRLSIAHSQDTVKLATLLFQLCVCLELQPLAAYYRRQHALVTTVQTPARLFPAQRSPIQIRLHFDGDVAAPEVFVWLRDRLQAFSSSGSSWAGGIDGGGGGGRGGGFGSFEPVTSQFSGADSEFPRLKGANEWKRDASDDPAATVHPLWRTDAVCRIFELLFSSSGDADDFGDEDDDMMAPMPQSQQQQQQPKRYDIARLTELMEFLTDDNEIGHRLSLEDLPVGIRFVVLEAIRVYREDPPHDVSERVCALIGRRDLAGHYQSPGGGSDATTTSSSGSSNANPSSSLVESTRLRSSSRSPSHAHSDAATLDAAGATREVSDGLVDVVVRSQRFFPTDQRLKEVARLLRSNRPLSLRLEKTSDVSDQDFVLQQQTRLLLLCKRSMALSVARGMVTIGTFDLSTVQNQAWQLSVPALPLAGRTLHTNATVLLDVSGYAKELTHWPQFHNGCATGLRLPARDLSSIITRYWIKYHRPSASDFQRLGATMARNQPQQQQQQQSPSSTATARDLEEAHAAHAGVLLGLGLNGHLKCLSMADVYNYLSLSNEFITVAILLGMAATAARNRRKRKSSSAAVQAARRRQRARARDAGGLGGADTAGNTQLDAATQDDPQGPTGASQAVNADVDMEMDANVVASAAAVGVTETQPHPDDHATGSKTPLPGGVPGLELSLERSVSKMLCLHIPSLLPPAFAEFSVPASTQTAALLGLGILYQGSGHRLMTELLLTEITRSPASAQFVTNQHSTSGSNQSSASSSSTPFDQHEGYSLAAGLALGLVLLGRGGATSGDPGLADLGLEEKLYKYIVGGAAQPAASGGGDANSSGSYLYRGRKWKPFGSGLDSASSIHGTGGGGANGSSSHANGGGANNSRNGDSSKPPSSNSDPRSSWRGEHVNIGVTACGSALALAFMYLKSGNKSCASQLAVPDTLTLLDYVRPDILLIRTLAKNLVLWDNIEPTKAWIETSQVPEQLRDAHKIIQRQGSSSSSSLSSVSETLPDHADIRSICESYANIVAGACLSVGLRFAGTSDGSARDTLRHFVLFFRDMRSRSALLGGDLVAAATDRVTIERCLAVCAQALALVDAGTGNLETFTLLRSINLKQRVDNELTYGNHMALSMAIGLLFLGGGRATVSRSNEAIAALVVALYPVSAMNTADNKYHLQAFRHLYTLAVDTSRHVETVEATSGEPCSVQLRVVSHADRPSAEGATVATTTTTLTTPCLLPELDAVDRIVVESGDTFYPVDIHLEDQDPSDGDDVDDWRRARRRSSFYGIQRPTGTRTTANDNRVKLLLEKSTILLERRVVAPQALMGVTALGFSTSSRRSVGHGDHDEFLLRAFAQYFEGSTVAVTALQKTVDDNEESTWWRERLTQLEPLGVLRAATTSRARQWPTYLSVLFEIFTLHHPRQRLQSLVGLWNVKLVQEFHRMDPFRSLVDASTSSSTATAMQPVTTSASQQHQRDFVEWLRAQTEEALRHRWRTEASTSLPSLATVQRVLLLTDHNHDHEGREMDPLNDDTLLMAALFVLFDAPASVWSDAADWRQRMQRALAISSSSSSHASSASSSSFAVDRFLLYAESELTTHEQTFWLRLVSCFLFSV